MSSIPIPGPPSLFPLPPGWTEHVAPGGQPYFYHAATNQSTYIRPIPSFPLAPPPQTSPPSEQPKTKNKKKEKPLSKTPIPGTDWIRVKTTEGNVFYTHREKKESVWTLPDEIAEAVEELEKEEVEAEAERTIREVEEKAKRLPTPPPPPVDIPKRKAEPHVDGKTAKKAKVNPEPTSPPLKQHGSDDGQEMVQEDAPNVVVVEDPGSGAKGENVQVDKPPPTQYNMPNQVNLTTDEAKALFKTLLQEKDISALTPYDVALPQLIRDPRYVLLPSITDRHAVFNEYCLEKTRAQRAAKKSSQATTGSSGEAKDSPQKSRESYESLLKTELTSTRTSWDEFRKKWKKDRRFFGFGRDDRERERVFREWRSSLGERKRREAQLAETNFFALLQENEEFITPNNLWKDVKKNRCICQDPRYEAIGSSSLREELFTAYLKSKASSRISNDTNMLVTNPPSAFAEVMDEDTKKRLRQERIEKGLKEREAKVQLDKAKLDQDIGRSRGNLTGERGAEEYQTLLTDAIRDPLATFQSATQLLSQFPAFTNSPLRHQQKVNLFNAHVSKLRQRQMAALYALFEGYTPSLNARFEDLPVSIWTSSPATKLGLSIKPDEVDYHPIRNETHARAEMKQIFDDWQADQYKKACREFDELLGENSFVEFWGGVNQMAKNGKGVQASTIHADVDDEDDEGEEGGGKADLKKLAKGIGQRQVEDVLKHEKRYQVFGYIPEQREQWIKEHLARLSAPKLSVHTSNDM